MAFGNTPKHTETWDDIQSWTHKTSQNTMYIVKDGISDFMTSCYPPYISALFFFFKKLQWTIGKVNWCLSDKKKSLNLPSWTSTSQVGFSIKTFRLLRINTLMWNNPWKQSITIFNKKYIFRFSWIFQLVMLVSRHVTNIYQYFCCRNYVLVVCLAWKKSLSIFQWGLRIHSSNVNLTVRPWK